MAKKRTRKKRSILKRIIIFILIFALGGIFYSFGVSTFEYFKVNNMVKEFKARGIEDGERIFNVSLKGVSHKQVIRYFKVPRETSDEQDGLNVFSDIDKTKVGRYGDIYTTRQSPFPQIPVIHQFVTYYFGGHAAISDGIGFYEALGYPEDNKTLLDYIFSNGKEGHGLEDAVINYNGGNYWMLYGYTSDDEPEFDKFGYYYRNEFFGLRVKDVTDDQKDQVIDFLNEKAEVPSLYNFLFFLNMKNKYYCTDLVSRAYQSVMVEENKQRKYSKALNDDGFITSVNDLILSNETYMTLYFEVEKEEIDGILETVAYVYYLEDVE